MPEALGLGLIQIGPQHGAGWRVREIQDVARAAEGAGFEVVFCAEVNNDAIASAELMGLATSRLKVGTWIAHIYLRLPYLCALGGSKCTAAPGAFSGEVLVSRADATGQHDVAPFFGQEHRSEVQPEFAN